MSFITPGFGGGSGSVTVDGNGYVVHQNGQLFGREVLPFGMALVEGGDGLFGPLRVGTEPTLAKKFTVNGNVTTDQQITIFDPGYAQLEYVIEKIVLCHSTAVPTAMQGGIYTLAGKTGEQVVPSTQLYTALGNSTTSMLTLTPTPTIRSAPYLFFSLTTANGSAITFDVFIYGYVLPET